MKTLKSNFQKITEVKLYADGGSRGNPGPSASAFVLFDEANRIIAKDGSYIGFSTNNQAEYRAILQGLNCAKQINVKAVHVYMDSLLVINQMKGTFKIKNPDLLKIYKAVQSLIKNFEKVDFFHIPREMNKIADEQVNKILDANN
jgi:ribonuclease HI